MMELSWTLGPDQSAGDRHSLQGLASRLKHNLKNEDNNNSSINNSSYQAVCQDFQLIMLLIWTNQFFVFIATHDRGAVWAWLDPLKFTWDICDRIQDKGPLHGKNKN